MKTKRFVSTLLALLLICGLPLSAFAEEYDLSVGSVTVNVTESGQTVTHGSNAAVPDSAPVITQSNSSTPTTNTVTINAAENTTANVTIQDVNIVISDPAGSPQNHSGQAAITIDVADGASANVTLDGVNINTKNTGGEYYTVETGEPSSFRGEAAVQITGNGDVTLELDGENAVQSGFDRAGVEKNTTADSGNGELTITDENETAGSLNANGGDWGSGIGGGALGSGSNITIEGNANVTANGGSGGAGIGGGVGRSVSGSDIIITESAKVTANGGDLGSGIGGGSGGSGSDITISGSAEVTAKGGAAGSGIGGGYTGSGSENITVSGDAQVKTQGGSSYQFGPNYYGAGAAIGEGGKYMYNSEADPGDDVAPNTNALNEGWVATYAPGTTNLDTAIPSSLTYKDANGTVQTEEDPQNIQLVGEQPATSTAHGHKAGFQIGNQMVAVTIHSFTNYVSDNNATYDADGTKTAQCDHCDATHTIPDPGSKLVREETVQPTQPAAEAAPLYRVIDQDGKALSCMAERQDGVLTITVDADFASLTGKLGGIQTLKAQGVDTIVFVTNGASSTFALADLLSQGSTGDTYTLTHDGAAVTFTLGTGKTDISDILTH